MSVPPAPHLPPLASVLRMPVSTPIKWRSAGNINSSQPSNRERELLDVAQETTSRFLGPIKTKDFFARLMPVEGGNPPIVPSNFLAAVAGAETEANMYLPFIDAMKKLEIPNLRFVNTSNHPDPHCDDMKPDIGVYPGVHDNIVADFSLMEMYGEFKRTRTDDAFNDFPDQLFEHPTDAARLTKGQIASYAAALLATQYRTHAFSFLLTGKTVRFIRWDRSCAIVSEAASYDSCPDILVEFFWRYSQLSAGLRGHDTSAMTPTPDEIQTARACLGIPDSTSRMIKLLVPSSEMQEPRYYIVPAPKYTFRSPFGRCTRACRAYHTEKEQIVYVKDYWRIVEDGMEKEGDIYKELHIYGVPHIPPFDCGGDVLEHETLGHQWVSENRGVTIEHYRHYRMGILAVGRSLVSFNSSWEYVNAIADAMEAHQCALIGPKILHRDISVGNILISENGGYLIDWDLCARVGNASHSSPRRHGRTGTWPFISAALLQQANKLHDHEDDRESALHLLIWMALKYTRTNQSPHELRYLLSSFDETITTDVDVAGGETKTFQLIGGYYPKNVKFSDRPLLDELVAELTETFPTRYSDPPSDVSDNHLRDILRELQEDERLGMNLSSMITRIKHALQRTDFAKWKECRAHLQEVSNWLVDTFRKYLSKRESWPKDDKAQSIVVANC